MLSASLNKTFPSFHCVMVITIVFMLIDGMFAYLFEYLSTGNGFHCVMVTAIDFMLVDTMFESHLCG